MMNKLKYLLIFISVFLLDAALNVANAQPPGGPPPGGGGTGTTPPCWDPDCIPIDGGVSLLIAAGVALGGKKLYNNYKNNTKQDS
jgi:hypothetical protein